MASGEDSSDVEALRRRLEDAEATLRAIRSGGVDALVMGGIGGERVYTLELDGADHPYRALIEAMQQGAASLSVDGTVLYCNRRFAEMVARPQETVIGAAMVGFVRHPHREAFEKLLRLGEGAGSQGEIEFERIDGTLTPVYLALAPLVLGDRIALCLVVTDLSEQKKHQDLLLVNRRKDEFLAMLAHELRNPLAPIRNALYLIRQGSIEAAEAGEVTSMMERQVGHLARLIDDLMDVARISSGKVELRPEELDLATVIGRAIEVSRPLIEQRNHSLTIDLPSGPISLRADPTRLEQIIDNLLTNAAKYTDPGGRLALSARLEGDSAVIKLRDNGIGIDPEKLPRIFDLFVQAERRLDRSQGGLGIGLSLVNSLVKMHGGQVTATSEGPGQGSEFVVRLPAISRALRSTPRPERAGPPEPGTPGFPSRRILIVDDNVDSAVSMALLLGRLWRQVVEVAHDGEEAIEKAAEFRPELVLLDIGLPGKSGYEVAEELRGRPESAGMTLVAMTGWGNEDDLRRSKESGFAHHMVKPVDLDALRDLLLTDMTARPGARLA